MKLFDARIVLGRAIDLEILDVRERDRAGAGDKDGPRVGGRAGLEEVVVAAGDDV